MQNLAPQRQTLNHIRVLLRMIVAQTRPALPAPYRQTRLLVARMRRMEVLLQIRNHPIARISVRPQERVIVADAVQALADLLLRERAAVVLAREGLDGAFFRLDVPLDLAPRAAFGVDLLGGDGDEVVAEWKEGRDLVIETRKGPGEDVDVIVIRGGAAGEPGEVEQRIHRLKQKILGKATGGGGGGGSGSGGATCTGGRATQD